jgi:hypothetical protein
MPRVFWRGRLVFACVLLLAARASALTIPLALGPTTIGTLTTIGPQVANTPSATGGVNFWASWSLLPESAVDASELRWLQRVMFSKAVSGFPNPNRAFIDPRPGQPLGSLPGGADALPWYDISGQSQGSLSLEGGGDDPWTGDGPYAPINLAPLTFTAETVVVAIDATETNAVILGGVRWGYALAGTSSSAMAFGPVGLADSAELRGDLNAALESDFPEWSLVAVPESGTLVLALFGLLTLCRAARRGTPARRA